MPLTNTAIQSAKPKEKPYKLFDEKGMYLEVSRSGGKLWRLKYRFDGKERRLALGSYPEVSLKDARERRDDARKLLANGIDPSEHRKAAKAARAYNRTKHLKERREMMQRWSDYLDKLRAGAEIIPITQAMNS